jgi:membrane protease YdiL (CAAX protease family)
MDPDLKCSKCGETFPSRYWFIVEGVCSSCYSGLSTAAKADLGFPIHRQSAAKELTSFPTTISAFFVPVAGWILSGFVMILMTPFHQIVTRQVLFLLSYTIASGTLLLPFTLRRHEVDLPRYRRIDFRLPTMRTLLLSAACSLAAIVGLISGLSTYGHLVRTTSSHIDYATLLNPYVVFTALVLGPTLEELLYRGILLGRLLRKYSPGTAVIVSSLSFGLAHEPAKMISAMVVGLVIGWVYWRTGSMIIAMSMHAIGNSFPIIFLVAARAYAVPVEATPGQPMTISVLCLTTAACAALVVVIGRVIARTEVLPQWRRG